MAITDTTTSKEPPPTNDQMRAPCVLLAFEFKLKAAEGAGEVWEWDDTGGALIGAFLVEEVVPFFVAGAGAGAGEWTLWDGEGDGEDFGDSEGAVLFLVGAIAGEWTFWDGEGAGDWEDFGAVTSVLGLFGVLG